MVRKGFVVGIGYEGYGWLGYVCWRSSIIFFGCVIFGIMFL